MRPSLSAAAKRAVAAEEVFETQFKFNNICGSSSVNALYGINSIGPDLSPSGYDWSRIFALFNR